MRTPIVNFKLGDRVVISKLGRRSYQNYVTNPHGETGTVIEEINHHRWIHVKWDNGFSNEYQELEIRHADRHLH